MGISNCYTFCNMGRSEKADQEIIDVIDELIWDLEDVAERVAKRQARRTKRTYDRELEDFLGKFQKWFSSAGDWHGAEEKARKALVAKRQKAHAEAQRIKDHNAWNPAHPDMVWAVNNRDNIFYRHGKKGKWSKVPGGLKQVSIGPVGTFGVNKYDAIFYRTGTHEGKNPAGHGWQRLPGALKWVSAGKNAVWGVNAADQIYCLSPIVLKGDQLDFSKMNWHRVPGGLKQISASKSILIN